MGGNFLLAEILVPQPVFHLASAAVRRLAPDPALSQVPLPLRVLILVPAPMLLPLLALVLPPVPLPALALVPPRALAPIRLLVSGRVLFRVRPRVDAVEEICRQR
jgi:hypothetical protein